jgi:hypothetical protein
VSHELRTDVTAVKPLQRATAAGQAKHCSGLRDIGTAAATGMRSSVVRAQTPTCTTP